MIVSAVLHDRDPCGAGACSPWSVKLSSLTQPVPPLQVNKPPQKFKKKTVFFLKTAPGKVDHDNIKKLVGGLSTPCHARRDQPVCAA
jgi:hypothetical protein